MVYTLTYGAGARDEKMTIKAPRKIPLQSIAMFLYNTLFKRPFGHWPGWHCLTRRGFPSTPSVEASINAEIRPPHTHTQRICSVASMEAVEEDTIFIHSHTTELTQPHIFGGGQSRTTGS